MTRWTRICVDMDRLSIPSAPSALHPRYAQQASSKHTGPWKGRLIVPCFLSYGLKKPKHLVYDLAFVEGRFYARSMR